MHKSLSNLAAHPCDTRKGGCGGLRIPSPPGKFRREFRMFEAMAAGRVKHNEALAIDEKGWREKCLNPCLKAALSSSCILADDVAVSIAAMMPDRNMENLIEKVPCWRPPFDLTWVEMNLRKIPDEVLCAWTGSTPKDLRPRPEAIGAFMRTNEVLDPNLILQDHPHDVLEAGAQENVRWIVEEDIWLMWDNKIVGPSCGITMFLDDQGRDAKGMRTYTVPGKDNESPDEARAWKLVPPQEELDKLDANGRRELVKMLRSGLGDFHKYREKIELRRDEFGAALFAHVLGGPMMGYAVGLMHCKNVVTEVATDKDRKLDPRLPRSGVQYRVLKVRPMFQKRGATVGEDAGDPQPLALHVVRGHFSDYRNGRGLFGKHRNVYWWSPHLRGSSDNGEVVKDYAPQPMAVPT